jgi:hypothetical protein
VVYFSQRRANPFKYITPNHSMKKKICLFCKERLSYSEFGADSSSPDGYNKYCYVCVRRLRALRLKHISLDKILRRDGWKCASCHKPELLVPVRIIEKSLRGKFYLNNHVTLCQTCATNPNNISSKFKKVCFRCDHVWIALTKNDPIVCPKCHNPYWNKPKREMYGD